MPTQKREGERGRKGGAGYGPDAFSCASLWVDGSQVCLPCVTFVVRGQLSRNPVALWLGLQATQQSGMEERRPVSSSVRGQKARRGAARRLQQSGSEKSQFAHRDPMIATSAGHAPARKCNVGTGRGARYLAVEGHRQPVVESVNQLRSQVAFVVDV